LRDGQIELELGGQLGLGVEPVAEVHTADAAVGVDLARWVRLGVRGETSWDGKGEVEIELTCTRRASM
jgi:hypothetical protein